MSAINQFSVIQPWLESLPRGLVLFGADGHSLFANGRARAWLGRGASHSTFAKLAALLASAGFLPDEVRSARWARGDLVLELSIESTPQGTRLWLDEVQQTTARRLKFLSVASHDIRGALANARSFAALLLHPKWTLDEKVRSGLEVIVRNTDKAMSLAQEIFDSLRAEILPLDVDVQELPLRPMIESVVTRARDAAGEREVGVELHLEESLPHWLTDGTRLGHVLEVLLDHAIARTPPHGVCHVDIAATTERLVVAVRDGGSDESDLGEGLFDRDTRVDRTTKLDTGFRLSLARDEVHALGGTLEAMTVDPGGLVLTVTLTRSAATALATSPEV